MNEQKTKPRIQSDNNNHGNKENTIQHKDTNIQHKDTNTTKIHKKITTNNTTTIQNISKTEKEIKNV